MRTPAQDTDAPVLAEDAWGTRMFWAAVLCVLAFGAFGYLVAGITREFSSAALYGPAVMTESAQP